VAAPRPHPDRYGLWPGSANHERIQTRPGCFWFGCAVYIYSSLLLTVLAHTLRVRFLLTIAVAGIFALLHFIFYELGPAHTMLSGQALTTLLFVGVALNKLFLATGSIAFPWAIHFGWNLTRFGNAWIGQSSPKALPQGSDFNMIEGNPWVIALAVALALVARVTRSRLIAIRVGANAKAAL
jgi:hypothetical protein